MLIRLDTSLELLSEKTPDTADARVLATIVATAGSTYRKPGARMLMLNDGSYFGLLTGGCLEADLKIHAQQVMHSGIARAVEYDMRGPDDELFGIGAGCEGAMRVLLEPAGQGSVAATALAAASRAGQSGAVSALVLVHDSAHTPLGTFQSTAQLPQPLLSAAQDALADGKSKQLEWTEASRSARAFVEFLAPPPHLLICGAGPDAQPVVAAARALGWRVTVVDHRAAYAQAKRFPGAAVHLADARLLRTTVDLERCHAAVVMSHHLLSDEAYLRALAQDGTPGYVGLLGPRARRSRLLHELGRLGDGLRHRIRGPVGIDIGSATPEGIAISIISEIHAWLAGKAVSLE